MNGREKFSSRNKDIKNKNMIYFLKTRNLTSDLQVLQNSLMVHNIKDSDSFRQLEVWTEQ